MYTDGMLSSDYFSTCQAFETAFNVQRALGDCVLFKLFVSLGPFNYWHCFFFLCTSCPAMPEFIEMLPATYFALSCKETMLADDSLISALVGEMCSLCTLHFCN